MGRGAPVSRRGPRAAPVPAAPQPSGLRRHARRPQRVRAPRRTAARIRRCSGRRNRSSATYSQRPPSERATRGSPTAAAASHAPAAGSGAFPVRRLARSPYAAWRPGPRRRCRLPTRRAPTTGHAAARGERMAMARPLSARADARVRQSRPTSLRPGKQHRTLPERPTVRVHSARTRLLVTARSRPRWALALQRPHPRRWRGGASIAVRSCIRCGRNSCTVAGVAPMSCATP